MDGVVVVDKPQGLTSHDVVGAVRRMLRERRIGHTGTLDPLATGVLPLACGRATRLVRFLSAADKTYEATIRFGLTTNTYDVTGEETSCSGRQPQTADLGPAVASLSGRYDQRPPAYSAKKVGGRRAYELAREDQPVELRPVPVHVSSVEILGFTGDRLTIALTCSAGFYVRSFAHELGERLGTGACLEELRRTRSGDFTLDGAATLDALHDDGENAVGWLVDMDSLLPSIPAVRLTEEGRLRVSHGRGVEAAHMLRVSDRQEAEGPGGAGTAWTRLIDEHGHLVALAQAGAAPESLHPAVVLI